ncbi:hypothetical protein L484_019791 [Morus notabilis]|uniref:Uncharacterized protein n=1 Tax=Morus notabilis TaxID=981085 RepID=W9RTX9_9ROSA|nr:hypothetical protein L484_019791 [Morus notabilis]
MSWAVPVIDRAGPAHHYVKMGLGRPTDPAHCCISTNTMTFSSNNTSSSQPTAFAHVRPNRNGGYTIERAYIDITQ